MPVSFSFSPQVISPPDAAAATSELQVSREDASETARRQNGKASPGGKTNSSPLDNRSSGGGMSAASSLVIPDSSNKSSMVGSHKRSNHHGGSSKDKRSKHNDSTTNDQHITGTKDRSRQDTAIKERSHQNTVGQATAAPARGAGAKHTDARSSRHDERHQKPKVESRKYDAPSKTVNTYPQDSDVRPQGSSKYRDSDRRGVDIDHPPARFNKKYRSNDASYGPNNRRAPFDSSYMEYGDRAQYSPPDSRTHKSKRVNPFNRK